MLVAAVAQAKKSKPECDAQKVKIKCEDLGLDCKNVEYKFYECGSSYDTCIVAKEDCIGQLQNVDVWLQIVDSEVWNEGNTTGAIWWRWADYHGIYTAEEPEIDELLEQGFEGEWNDPDVWGAEESL